jgi:hypothetical protein
VKPEISKWHERGYIREKEKTKDAGENCCDHQANYKAISVRMSAMRRILRARAVMSVIGSSS